MLADMLAGREMIDTELQKTIQRRIDGWGINVLSVEIRDVEIPVNLQNAMSMQAQADVNARPGSSLAIPNGRSQKVLRMLQRRMLEIPLPST